VLVGWGDWNFKKLHCSANWSVRSLCFMLWLNWLADTNYLLLYITDCMRKIWDEILTSPKMLNDWLRTQRMVGGIKRSLELLQW
jgi:hypothetical protein